MRKRFIILLALMLCVGAVLFTFPAYATNAPTTESPAPQDSPAPSETPPPEPTPTPEPVIPEPTESAISIGAFTPDGTGTVMDNASDYSGKEFFTIKTDSGSVFYLIVDRQRSGENVYLLTAVTEEDLAAMAKSGDNTESGIPTEEPPVVSTSPEPSPEPSPAPKNSDGGGAGTIIFIIIAAVVVGVAGYYFKIVKPRKRAPEDEEEDYVDGVDDDDEDYETEEEKNP